MLLSPGIEVSWALEGEGTAFFRTSGNVTQRHGVTSQQLWILNAAVGKSRNCADVRNNSRVGARCMSVT